MAANLVWPPRSLIGGEVPVSGSAIAPDDFAQLTFLSGSGCRRCAVPTQSDLGEASVCGACAAKAPRWNQARAALAYDEVSRRAILDLKHAGRRDGLDVLGNWMAIAGDDILRQSDALLPVPLHYRRLATRGFNQSAWLAEAISKRCEKPVWQAILKRKRATPTQGGLSPKQRAKNVAGAFKISERARKRICGKTVTLVDDVYTTGSTLKACTRALKEGGVADVHVLVLARVVRPQDITL